MEYIVQPQSDMLLELSCTCQCFINSGYTCVANCSTACGGNCPTLCGANFCSPRVDPLGGTTNI